MERGATERELATALASLGPFKIKISWVSIPKTGSEIGIGGFGTVHRALLCRKSSGNVGVPVTVKKLKAAGSPEKRLRMEIASALVREMGVWASLLHESITPLVGFHVGDQRDEAWLISPLMANGNLIDYLIDMRPDKEKRHQLTLDTARGLQYLHSLDPPLCYGDIKALNVLINDQHRAVFCDFGLAKAMEGMPSGLTTSTFNQSGSLPYESPELLLGTSTRTPQSDVWAWGCLVNEIFSGKAPYHWAINPGAIVKWIIQNIPPATFDDTSCPTSIQVLLSYCWRFRSIFRPTMARCLAVLLDPTMTLDAIHEALKVSGDRVPNQAITFKGSDLTLDDDVEVGSGHLGILFKAKLVDERTGTTTVVAMKQLFKAKDSQPADRFPSIVRDKANQWTSLLHPNILYIVGHSLAEKEVSPNIFLVFPYMSTGNIVDYIKEKSPDYDRRMKLRNVLIDDKGNAMLCDYDTNEIVANLEEHVVSDLFRYRSPEHLTGNTEQTLRSDIWCWASTFLQIMTDQAPYQDFVDENALLEALGQGVMPANIGTLDCPPRAQNILGMCWRWEPGSRASLGDIISILSGKFCQFTTAWSMPGRGLSCAKFSHDGKYLVIGREGVGLGVHDASTGALQYELPPIGPGHTRAQMSRSGGFLITPTRAPEHNVCVWDLNTRAQAATFQGHSDAITTIDMSSDDASAFSISDDRAIRMWHIGSQMDSGRVLKETKGIPSALAVSPTAGTVAVSAHDGGAELLDADTGETIMALEQRANIWALRFAADGDLPSTKGEVGEVRTLPCIEIKVRQESVLSVSGSGPYIVSMAMDGEVRAIKLDSGATSMGLIGSIGGFAYSRYVSWDAPGAYMY
ncbi:hypothetical protein FRB99_001014 [Tulasnella sp. 403]|nr:hypothetical protein FRB99_001014 [Tulasnella sp. 403]